jgi:CHASE3 domain sensor protein|tara:strand:- start:1535 stop:2005 length:471 start_codon:yes stop_codon:yes gene_type:complete
MEPISTALTGIALVQKSVSFIKSNISTASDIKDIASALDGLFAGEKQIQSERFSEKSMIGQTKDAANKVIDAKLAKEAMDEMRILINHRFGHGTFQQIIAERNKQIREEKERIAEAKRIARKRAQERKEVMMILAAIAGGLGLFFLFLFVYLASST